MSTLKRTTSPKLRRTKALAALATALVALTAAACSSSSSSNATGSATGSGSGSVTSTAGSTAKGSPLKLVTVVEDFGEQSDLIAGANIAIDAINASGGVDGHPLQLVTCQHQSGDDNPAGTCLSSALQDPSVVAGVAFSTTASAVTTPMLNKAKIACIGCAMFGTADFTSPSFFADWPGFLEDSMLVPLAHSVLGAKVIAFAYNSQTAASSVQLAQVAAPAGVKIVPVPINPTQADLTSTAATMIAAKPDAIIGGAQLPLMTKLLLAAQSQGANIPLVMSALPVGPKTTKSVLQGINSNVVVMSDVDRSSAGFAEFMRDLQKYSPSQQASDEAVNTWMQIKLEFAKDIVGAIPKGTTITRSSVFSAANTLSAVNTDGLTPTMNWTKPTNYLGGKVTRAFNLTGYAYKADNNQWVQDGGMVRLFANG
jgi:ABC-type branched-subunit amino acid transport system substrate-binding protein